MINLVILFFLGDLRDGVFLVGGVENNDCNTCFCDNGFFDTTAKALALAPAFPRPRPDISISRKTIKSDYKHKNSCFFHNFARQVHFRVWVVKINNSFTKNQFVSLSVSKDS